MAASGVRVILVCGYRRHGKDTLYQVLSGTSTLEFDRYYLEESSAQLFDSAFCQGSSFTRIAFADILKQDVAKELAVSVDFLEENKDHLLREVHKNVYTFDYILPEVEGSPTYRDVLINHSARCKSKDIAYFPRRAFEYATKLDTVYVVTDWRYTIEYEYACEHFGVENVFTIRVFRPGMIIPYYSIQSEHELDTHDTHAVFQPKDSALRFIYLTTGYRKP